MQTQIPVNNIPNKELRIKINNKNVNIRVEHQSLLDSNVEAIVNAANTSMRGGGGIDGAIHSKAGAELLSSLEKNAPKGCPTGEVIVTPGFNTGFEYIFHTPGPIWKGGNENELELLENCYWNCLNEANRLNVTSIGFCSISTGIYGYPLDLASKIAINTIFDYMFSASDDFGVFNVDTIVFAMFGESEYEAFCNALEYSCGYQLEPMQNVVVAKEKVTFWDRLKSWFIPTKPTEQEMFFNDANEREMLNGRDN